MAREAETDWPKAVKQKKEDNLGNKIFFCQQLDRPRMHESLLWIRYGPHGREAIQNHFEFHSPPPRNSMDGDVTPRRDITSTCSKAEERILISQQVINKHQKSCNWKYPVGYYWCSVAKSCPILCNPMNCSTPGFPILHYLLELAQTHVHWVVDAIQPFYPLHPLLLLPSIFPSIRVFSNELALCIRWPK